MWTRTYFQDLTERMVRAGAASFASLLTFGAVNVLTLDWKTALGAAGGAALYSLLMSLIGSQVGDPTTGSLLLGPPGRHELRK